MDKRNILIFIILLSLISFSFPGPIAMGLCYTACNTVWVACVSAAGGIAGVSTGGAAVPAAILACNAAQGTCMGICTTLLFAPTL